MNFPKRLYQIYSLAQGHEIWDIGCDHSILARINLKEKKFSHVYCVDKSKASLDKIVQEMDTFDRQLITLIESDGCQLNWEKVSGTVVIAGVGANTVIKIVEACPIKFRMKINWILNPFTSVSKFVKESAQIWPTESMEKYEVQENGRTRLIFRFLASVAD